jgi:hypothetical protein
MPLVSLIHGRNRSLLILSVAVVVLCLALAVESFMLWRCKAEASSAREATVQSRFAQLKYGDFIRLEKGGRVYLVLSAKPGWLSISPCVGCSPQEVNLDALARSKSITWSAYPVLHGQQEWQGAPAQWIFQKSSLQ